MIKILNLNLVILLEYQIMKMFQQKVALQIGLKNVLSLKKLKILYTVHMILMISMEKKIAETFYEKEFQKTNQKEFRIEKKLREKNIYYIFNRSDKQFF